MLNFTKKQGQYLAFIHQYTKLNGVPPAEADIEKYFCKRPGVVHGMVKTLDEKGLISRIPFSPRSIQVLVPPEQLPPLGSVDALDEKPTKATWKSAKKQSWSQESYIKAYRFAAEAHQGQCFPGTDLPYLVHLSFVSMEIMTCLDVEKKHNGDFAVQTALLHDVLEDTQVTYREIAQVFGNKIAEAVLALTKNTSLDKEAQMLDSLERIKSQPDEVWMVKMADRISNLGPPPKYWTKERISKYREEALQIHKALSTASDYLSLRLIEKTERYKVYL